MKLFSRPSRALERAHNLDVVKRPRIPADLQRLLDVAARMPLEKVSTDTTDGIKKSVEMHPLRLSNPTVFRLVHALSLFRPFVYAQTAIRAADFGVLSPNFDTEGVSQQSSIKFLPLLHNVPLTAKLLPDVNAAAMLAGGAHSESQGMGSHGTGDIELQLTTMGAVVSGDHSIALKHRNHTVRQTSSVVTGLTDGRLGRLYTPNRAESAFPGYGSPQVFQPGATDATVYLPHSFLAEPLAFGVNFPNAGEIMLARGLQTMEGALGSLMVATQRTESLTDQVRATASSAHKQLGL